ncbi:hypothetical protein [Nostocoides jenkinsii]|uniref:Uncharacterized protein n=1 Tax=Nostocoides jenkinsii Ben 74 TaxID=1193518 RepID=A0A077MBA4_9MICO|nr:hypothetical protein [Tetrasphaera jenkinsii]CCI54636.1 hypothetical protein BN13_80005 [Tetrasphaera jenkinsii Ben 74]
MIGAHTSSDALVARANAIETRARWLMTVAAGSATVWDVVEMCRINPKHPCRRLAVVDIIGAQPNVSQKAAVALVTRALDLAKCPDPVVIGKHRRRPFPTVAWLIDGRAETTLSRVAALSEALVGHPFPWDGWPYGGAPGVIAWT